MKQTAKIDMGQSPAWVINLVGAALFMGIGIALHGILLSVDYRWHRVLDVQTIPGGDAFGRIVLVDAPDRYRVLRTGDHLLRVEKGERVCVAKRRMIAKRWVRWSLELPGYCRNVGPPTPEIEGLMRPALPADRIGLNRWDG